MSSDDTKAVASVAEKLVHTIPLHHLRDPSLIDELAARWCERHRFWHGPEHLLQMLACIQMMPPGDERETLLLAALYHDAIYDPRAADNELRSAALLLDHARNRGDRIITNAAEIVIESKWSGAPSTALAQQFFLFDSHQLTDDCPLHARQGHERAIFREYQWADWPTYRVKRREFLNSWALTFPRQSRGCAECIELLEGLQPRIAIYPGSFDPFHLGHLSILRQAERVFDKVIVAVGVNRQKAGAIESAQRRMASLQARLRFHEVVMFGGLLTRFLDEFQAPLTIVRGVRDGTDLEAELRYVRFINELRPRTGVVWIGCEAELQHLSSSAIRELEAIEPGAGERYIPDVATIYELADVSSIPVMQ